MNRALLLTVTRNTLHSGLIFTALMSRTSWAGEAPQYTQQLECLKRLALARDEPGVTVEGQNLAVIFGKNRSDKVGVYILSPENIYFAKLPEGVAPRRGAPSLINQGEGSGFIRRESFRIQAAPSSGLPNLQLEGPMEVDFKKVNTKASMIELEPIDAKTAHSENVLLSRLSDWIISSKERFSELTAPQSPKLPLRDAEPQLGRMSLKVEEKPGRLLDTSPKTRDLLQRVQRIMTEEMRKKFQEAFESCRKIKELASVVDLVSPRFESNEPVISGTRPRGQPKSTSGAAR